MDETPLPPAEGAPGTAADPLASTVEPSPQLPDPNLRYAYDQVDRAPVPLSTQLPAYTPERPGRGSEGSLELDVLVGADGHIAAVRVARGIDDAALRRSAVSAILRWRFAPGSHRGVEVPVWVPVRLEFSRSGDEMRGVVKLAH